MRAKYQHENIGTQQSAIQRLFQERFLSTDSPDTYEKRIQPLLLSVADNDATVLSFLKNHLSGDFYTWMKIANPAGIDAYFTNLKNIWLESRDLAYTEIETDDATLENFIYEELKKRLGGQTVHVRKSLFTSRSIYATKKVVRKVKLSKASAKQIWYCLTCKKVGHTKINCPKFKWTKKVNYVYQDEEEEDSKDSKKYIVEEKKDLKEEEIKDNE
ncbi:hypothetical protein RclHR1_21680002 [Rhizophagus clarus]|uniref:CCHC-type domain-containing protein n=1 Tax=Rhizophagus clarus TaxID=94130 RepID=A0A2Z6RM57_9GLOM|nr:hypothetical protein RclHR1_21680002 [Rhizophagus clarus]